MRTPAAIALLLSLLLTTPGAAATWQGSVGATFNDGGALEVSRYDRHWEVALGYLGPQTVLVRHITLQCPWQGAPAEACTRDVRKAHATVNSYAYLSVQRRIVLGPYSSLRPVLGFGFVGQTDTNAYVSSTINLSLSAGLEIGERLTVQWRHFSNAGVKQPNLGQDLLLLRWTFR